MFYENVVILTGRAVKDAELKQVGSSQVCQFRLVSNKRIKKRDGEYGEKSCFIDAEAWGNRAEYASKYIKKGSIVRVQAELEQDEWESNGQKRQKHKLYVYDIQVERPRNADGSTGDVASDSSSKSTDSSTSDSSADSAQPAAAGASNSDGSGLPF